MTKTQAAEFPIWNVPNTVSFLRLTVLLPLSLGLLASGYYGASLVALFFMGSSDALDGFLARKLNQVTPLGAELDPLSDRASIVLVAVALVFGGLLPWYLFAAIVLVDSTLFGLAMAWFGGYPQVRVNMVGKTRTALLMLGLPGLILAAAIDSSTLQTVALVIVWAGVALHIVTGVTYALQMVELRRHSD